MLAKRNLGVPKYINENVQFELYASALDYVAGILSAVSKQLQINS